MPYVFHPDLSRLTISDAVEYLDSKMSGFDHYGAATIKVTRMGFPEFSERTLITLFSPLDANGNGIAVGMASAESFTARRALDNERRRDPAKLIADAEVDGFCNVTCANGEHLFDLRLDGLTPLRGTLRPTEWRALEFCVGMHEGKLGEAERITVYSELASRLAGFTPWSLKQIMGYIRDNQVSSEPSVSIETLREALRMMGLRRPKRGQYNR